MDGDMQIWPQDAPVGVPAAPMPLPQDWPPGAGPLTPGWYASPDGSRTLSWWTGAQWSRTLATRPAPRDTVLRPRPVSASRPRRRRSLPATLGLSLGLGPAGAVYANWRIGVPMAGATWLAVTQSADPYPGFTYALLLPINIAVGLHLASRHNERADDAEARRGCALGRRADLGAALRRY